MGGRTGSNGISCAGNPERRPGRGAVEAARWRRERRRDPRPRGARGGRRRQRPPRWPPWPAAVGRGERGAVGRQEGDRVGPTDGGGGEVPSIEGMERGV
jgi:hypothetical protein